MTPEQISDAIQFGARVFTAAENDREAVGLAIDTMDIGCSPDVVARARARLREIGAAVDHVALDAPTRMG